MSEKPCDCVACIYLPLLEQDDSADELNFEVEPAAALPLEPAEAQA